MIDIGANLSNEQFKPDLAQVIDRAKSANVQSLVLTSVDEQSFYENKKIISLFGNEMKMMTTLGVHPHYVQKKGKQFLNNFDKLQSDEHICAWGEVGLDYYRMLSEKSVQQKFLEQFLEQIKNYKHLGLFLHERQASMDFCSILDNSQTSNAKIVHCFTGDRDTMNEYLKRDYFIGLTGWLSDSKRAGDLQKAVKYLPLDKIMIETDCPYLTPKNMEKKIYRNEPAFLIYVAREIARIKQIDIDSVLRASKQNSEQFFNINLKKTLSSPLAP